MASSTALNMAGTRASPARAYANTTAEPALLAASPGNKKKPALRVVPVASAYTPKSVSSFRSRDEEEDASGGVERLGYAPVLG